MSKRPTRAALQEALRRTQALQQLALALAQSHEDAALRLIVDQAVQVLHIDRAVLIVPTDDQSQVAHFLAAGPGMDQVRTAQMAELQQGLTGWVLRERTPAFSPEEPPDPRESPAVQQVRRATNCGFIAVLPVQAGGAVLATLTVIGPPGQPGPGEADLAWLSTLTHHAAAALEQRRLTRALRWQAQHDVLTGLPNRALFEDRAQQACKRVRRSGRGVLLCLLDLDGFKMLNDTHGHAAGDQLLQAVAERLQGALRASDTVCRWGGDEFTVLAEGVDGDEAVAVVVSKLRAAVEAPLRLAGGEVRPGVSVGTACLPEQGTDLRALLLAADGALYADKLARRAHRP